MKYKYYLIYGDPDAYRYHYIGEVSDYNGDIILFDTIEEAIKFRDEPDNLMDLFYMDKLKSTFVAIWTL